MPSSCRTRSVNQVHGLHAELRHCTSHAHPEGCITYSAWLQSTHTLIPQDSVQLGISVSLPSAICLMRARAYQALDNRMRAIMW